MTHHRVWKSLEGGEGVDNKQRVKTLRKQSSENPLVQPEKLITRSFLPLSKALNIHLLWLWRRSLFLTLIYTVLVCPSVNDTYCVLFFFFYVNKFTNFHACLHFRESLKMCHCFTYLFVYVFIYEHQHTQWNSHMFFLLSVESTFLNCGNWC